MRRQATLTLLAAVAMMLGGCSTPQPSYSTVRGEALDALNTVVRLMPESTVVTPRAEQEPYSCNDPLMGNGANGAFHTAYWEVEVPPTMNIPTFIDALPSLLGEGWHAEGLGAASANRQVYLVHDDPSLSLTVEETQGDSRAGIDLIAISRCGILNDEDPSPSPADTGSPAPPRYKR